MGSVSNRSNRPWATAVEIVRILGLLAGCKSQFLVCRKVLYSLCRVDHEEKLARERTEELDDNGRVDREKVVSLAERMFLKIDTNYR